ncbi:MAG: TPR repeat protein [Myxococcota bacterium]|jgi:TPR repeat protein
MFLSSLLLLSGSADAAWPDIYPSRVAALQALRADLVTPDLSRDEGAIIAQYQRACKKGFPSACHWEEWVGDIVKAEAYFSRKCSAEPLACVVLGWTKTRVSGELSSWTPDAASGVKSFSRACKEAYAPGCTELGSLYLAGIGVEADPARAADLFEEGCKAKDWWGCHQLAEMHWSGEAQTPDLTEAARLSQIGCAHDIPQSCASLGVALENGTGISRDMLAAVQLYQQTCERGIIESCYALGTLYAEGRGVAPSPATAMGLFRMTCETGDQRGCYGVGRLYVEGDGVRQDAASAVQMFDGACEAGFAPACSQIGELYMTGNGLDRDKRLGMRYLRRGCEAGDVSGCEYLGEVLAMSRGDETDSSEAVRLLHQACTAGSGRACGLLAGLYEDGRAPEGDVSAESLRITACEKGDGESCRILATRHGGARQWFEKGCAGDDGESCGELGLLARDAGEPEAADWLRQACQLNHVPACVAAGTLFESAGDLPAALTLYERACEQDDEAGCIAAAPIAFEARFEDIIRQAFSSSLCQVWRIDTENAASSRLLVEVDGPRFSVLSGPLAGSEATAWHREDVIEEGATWAGRSHWEIGGGDAEENVWLHSEPLNAEPVWPPPPPSTESDRAWSRLDRYWEKNVEHYEAWAVKDGINGFPGPDSYARDQDGINSLAFSREDGSLRRLHNNGICRFDGEAPVLVTEHCSEIQALLAASLVTTCQ